MYQFEYLYPSDWTESLNKYVENKEIMKQWIVGVMKDYDMLSYGLQEQRNFLIRHYLKADKMFSEICK